MRMESMNGRADLAFDAGFCYAEKIVYLRKGTAGSSRMKGKWIISLYRQAERVRA